MKLSQMTLDREKTALVVVDIQERMMKAIPQSVGSRVVQSSSTLIQAATRLGLPVIITEQYPKGLGPTLESVKALAPEVTPIDKTSFSCCGDEKFLAALRATGRTSVILCGVEAHICVYMTARDLLNAGFDVFVAADAVASRSKMNWRIGLNLCTTAGAVLSNTETICFDLLKKAGGDDFKFISGLIK